MSTGLQLVDPNSQPAVSSVTPEKVDRFAVLYRIVEDHKPIKDEFEALRSEIGAAYDSHPADQFATAEGILWNLSISKKRQEATWKSKLTLWRKLGGLKALELWNVAQKAVKEKLGEAACEALLTRELTGYRQIRPVKRETVRKAA